MKLELTNHKVLKSAFESISKIVDEITLVADNEGIHLRAIDRSHITFIVMDLKKEFFDEYECETPEKINIDCVDFNQILKKCKNSDILEMTVDESNLILKFKGDATRKFEIGLIDLEYENAQPPMIEFPCTVNIPSGLIKEYVEDMEMFSDKISFVVDEDYLRIKTSGQKGNAETTYLHGEHINEVVESMFCIPKLKEIFRASKFSESCSLSIGNDNPLRVGFELVSGDGELSYLLAPRLEQD